MLHKLPLNTPRSNPLNEVSRWVTFAFPSAETSQTFPESVRTRTRDIADFLPGVTDQEASAALLSPLAAAGTGGLPAAGAALGLPDLDGHSV